MKKEGFLSVLIIFYVHLESKKAFTSLKVNAFSCFYYASALTSAATILPIAPQIISPITIKNISPTPLSKYLNITISIYHIDPLFKLLNCEHCVTCDICNNYTKKTPRLIGRLLFRHVFLPFF